jgi:hypothetical protein
MSHYAEAFSVRPGRCFRFTGTSIGRAGHCREPIVARGTFIDKNGQLWPVDACERHCEELDCVDGGGIG